MLVRRRLVVAGALACLPAAALGPGCAGPFESYPGLPNEVVATPGGPVSPTGVTSSAGGSGSGGSGGASGSGAGGGVTFTPPERCDCAVGVQAATCSTCFHVATTGLCASQNAKCGATTNCAMSDDCVNNCGGDPTCVYGCITASNVDPDYLALLDCVCIQCGNQCGPAQSCTTGTPSDAGSD